MNSLQPKLKPSSTSPHCSMGSVSPESAIAYLESLGASEIEHPGGTLLAHLRRTSELLTDWGARPALALAGLCHACYGTDGFPLALLDLAQRGDLIEVIGQEAEAIVYLYGSCDRGFVYPRLGRDERLSFRDRFTGQTFVPDHRLASDFTELTFANELDIITQSPTFAAENGPGIARLFRRCQGLVSDAAYGAFTTALAVT